MPNITPTRIDEPPRASWPDSALRIAVSNGSAAQVSALLGSGACDPLARGSDGRTLLHIASLRGESAIMEPLISAGGLDATDPHGRAALHLTVLNFTTLNPEERLLCLRLLIQAGANARIKAQDGATPMMLATALQEPYFKPTFELLRPHSDFAARDGAGLDLIQHAQRWNASSSSVGMLRAWIERETERAALDAQLPKALGSDEPSDPPRGPRL